MRVPVTPFADLSDDPQFTACLERRERGIGRGSAMIGEHAGLAAVEGHRPGLAVAVDFDIEPLGQRVDDGGADAVQTTGGRVRAGAELAAGMELGEYDLDPGEARSWVRCRPGSRARESRTSTLPSGCRMTSMWLAVTGECLVDGVVDDLPQAVHEAAGVG